MTREEAFKEINETQDYYINELINLILDPMNDVMKEINFTSPTGTGKTNMMSKLCNKLTNYYFVITTLSKGQLNRQISNNLNKLINQPNFVVYGLCDFTANTKLQAEEILSRLPNDKKIIWLRDEGHIHTNKWQKLITDECYKIINFSATNKIQTGIECNFTNTMMLRTVIQNNGTPEEALDKLLEVKNQHRDVKNYNPCAIMRCLDLDIENQVIKACEDRNLKYINITTEDYDMSDICRDDNEYDVILNKFKIVEGIDIRRAHVLYMTNEPSNVATTIQLIGRCRRNALLYRDDIDIFVEENKKLLKDTRQCYVYYNITKMKIDSDENGELCQAFCNRISCQKLKPNSLIHVEKGQLDNGLYIIELEGETGDYKVEIDKSTGFNIIKPEGMFYDERKLNVPNFWEIQYKVRFKDFEDRKFDYSTGECIKSYYNYTMKLEDTINDSKCDIQTYSIEKVIDEFSKYVKNKFKSIGYKFIDECKLWIQQLESLKFEYEIIEMKSSPKYTHKILYNDVIQVCPQINCYPLWITITTGEMKFCKKTKYVCVKIGDSIENEIFKFQKKYENHISEMICNLNQLIQQFLNLDLYIYQKLYEMVLENHPITYYKCVKIYNDRESSIVGTDLLKRIKKDNDEYFWTEDKAVTSKINKYSKLNCFIENRYKNQLLEVKSKLFNGKNNFEFDSKCNACLGYCVEYYSKYLVYGDLYMQKFIKDALRESHRPYVNDYIIVRACILKYKDNMIEAFGEGVDKFIRTISVEALIKNKYKEFVKTVIELGKKVADFIKLKLNITKQLSLNDKIYNPNLSINHITGLADYIDENTIIDIKVKNSITIENIKQVLAYHYLSTKRSDLNIKRVIVYDAVSGKSVEINL